MSKPLLSILVPIYNVESYLSTCLESLINQTLKDLEIICINDGSTDKSLDIIKSYQAKDSRIKLINKPNTGYGDSMNQGLRKAQGTYIGIVEPDDYIELNAFANLCNLAKKFQADVVRANYYRESSTQKIKITEISPNISHNISHKVLSPSWAKRSQSNTDRQDYSIVFQLSPAIWSAIYRREFLIENQIEFLPTPGASYQDTGFNFKVWAMAERVVLTDQAYLHYQIDNANSSINNPGKVNCVVEEYRSIEEYLRQHDLLDQVAPYMAATQFRNYHWNFQRLSPELGQEFYQKIRAALLSAKKHGWLQQQNFSKPHWLAVQGIIHAPKATYQVLRLRTKLH